ncbi:unnamed protein product [Bursaphelenchus xylophilus]|uniref:(pine wood nematode) hypothetical protein n=1 Tax=Bursaphelenchus xylophilus TaxID=6326 RepID=A0A1I7RPN7_BURXY|nr:unnamed protein product [Bursaphelenchus xylophilus]CAG9096356.1 unnamed protein product [Bursaphelenchus xylophilus]
MLGIYVNLLLLTVLASAEIIPSNVLHKRQAKMEIKKDNLGYSDEMFNIDTLAGIGLGKRSSPTPTRPRYALIVNLEDLVEGLDRSAQKVRARFNRFHEI